MTKDPWKDEKKYPVTDWQLEVANGDTRLGYWEWVERSKEANGDTATRIVRVSQR